MPTSGHDAGLEQQRARRRHRQEEREIDDDRMLRRNSAPDRTACALRHQRGQRHHRGGADEPERERDAPADPAKPA